MNKDHIESLIEQIEWGHKIGHKCDHSEKELKRLKGLLKPKDIAKLTWKEKVSKCKSRNDLEKLVLDEKKIDIDKRKKLKDLKEYALTL